MASRRDVRPVPFELRMENERLYLYLQDIAQDSADGLPAGFDETVAPSTVAADQAADPGPGNSWADALHVHPLAVGDPVDLGEVLSPGTDSAAARADHVHRILQRVLHAGILIGVKHSLNFIDSPTFTWTITLDAPNDRINIMGTVIGSPATPWNNNWWGPPASMYFG